MDNDLNLQIGLANIGNTCFFNSVLQCLRLCPKMGEIFLAAKPVHLREESKYSQFVLAFQTLMRDFWKECPPSGSRPTMIPRGFFQSLYTVLEETNNGWYQRGQQADAAEAIQYILESLHDGMYRRVTMEVVGNPSSCEEVSQIKAIESWSSYFAKEYSPIVHNFYGQTQICVRCEQCGSVTERYEPWLMIKAPIPGGDQVGSSAPSLDTCLTEAFASDTLDDYECNVCTQKAGHKMKGRATLTNRISRLPPIVILQIKRFVNERNKIVGKLKWDLDNVDLASVMAFSRNPYGEASHTSYETFAVIEHHGSLQGGHYTMYAKQNEQWLEYDDSSITDVTPDHVVSGNSYILFLLPKSETKSMNQAFRRVVQSLRESASPTEA